MTCSTDTDSCVTYVLVMTCLGGMMLCYKHEARGLSAYNINNIPTGRVIGDI